MVSHLGSVQNDNIQQSKGTLPFSFNELNNVPGFTPEALRRDSFTFPSLLCGTISFLTSTKDYFSLTSSFPHRVHVGHAS